MYFLLLVFSVDECSISVDSQFVSQFMESVNNRVTFPGVICVLCSITQRCTVP